MIKNFIIGACIAGSQCGLFAKQTVTLEDLFKNNTFAVSKAAELKYTPDGLSYTRLEGGTAIVKYNVQTGAKEAVLLDIAGIFDSPVKRFDFYTLSPDGRTVMIGTNRTQVYRHSFKADYYLADMKAKTVVPLSDKQQIMEPAFTASGDKIGFVWNNNIYIRDMRFGSEKQITKDGEFNKIINGLPDWVYEEEFAFKKAWEWSADGKMMAFIRFDESDVPEYRMTMFRGSAPDLKENELYPTDYTYKYPVAGAKNSTVKVLVYHTENYRLDTMDIPEKGDFYIPRIQWTPTTMQLCITALNRLQNRLTLYFANPRSRVCTRVVTEENDKYIAEDNLDRMQFLPDGERFVFLSEKEGFNQMYLYTYVGTMIKKLTPAPVDVTAFYGYDADKKLFYYQAAGKNAMQREVYSVDEKGRTVCLTTKAGTNEFSFSPAFKYYTHTFESATQVPVTVLYDAKGKKVRDVETNSGLAKKVSDYHMAQKVFVTVPAANGEKLNGWIMKPIDFDSTKTYPMVMVQYSGPGSQQVLDKWQTGWEQVLVSQGFVVTCADGRGTGARGEAFKKCTYMKLGALESDDQIAVAKYWGAKHWIDAKRMAIWGWSYGGFMTALTMCKSDVFAAGIAVAPVTHYKFYDSAYTERYMRRPQDNPKGYDENAPLMLAANLKGRLLLCHGTADDNVHYQNSTEFSEALVQAGIQFDMMTYTNRSHSIRGGNTTMHIYNRFLDFLNTRLGM